MLTRLHTWLYDNRHIIFHLTNKTANNFNMVIQFNDVPLQLTRMNDKLHEAVACPIISMPSFPLLQLHFLRD